MYIWGALGATQVYTTCIHTAFEPLYIHMQVEICNDLQILLIFLLYSDTLVTEVRVGFVLRRLDKAQEMQT